MAKKNDISSLVSGIIGNPDYSTDTSSEKESENSPATSFKEDLPAISPKQKREKNNVKKTLTTISLDPTLLKKVKYITVFSNISFTKIVTKCLEDYVKKWENKHGEINFPS